MKPDTSHVHRRAFSFDRQTIDLEARTVELCFSSEEPYQRYWGVEILDHTAEAVNMVRLADGAPLLLDHEAERDSHVGTIERAWIGADRRGRAVVRFSRRQVAEEALQDVADGILTKVSVGYMIDEVQLVEFKDGVETFRVTKWTPIEVSLVSIPADNSVGVGRSAGITKESTMDEVKSPAPVQAQPAPAAAQAPVAANVQVDDVAARRLAEVNEILAIGEQYARHGGREIAAAAVQAGKTARQVCDELLARMTSGASPAGAGEIGMSPKEQKRYSVLRLVRALANPTDSRLRAEAAFEFEAHQAAVQAMNGQTRGGFVIPMDVFKRDMTAAGSSGSNYLVGTNNQPGGLIDLLRNRMVVAQLGARTLDGLVGNVTIPRLSAGSTAYWLSTESTAITESQPTIGQLSLTPKTIAGLVDVSRQLMLQATPDAEALVMDDLLKVIAIGIDKAALNGAGSSGEPTGISATSGIGSVTGTSLALAGVIEFQTDVAAANALSENCAYVTTPAVAGLLAQRARISSTDSITLWKGNLLDGQIEGYRAAATNQIASASMIFGDFSQLILASWGSIELATTDSDSSKFAAGIATVRAMASVDVGVRIAAAFSQATSIT